MPNRPRSGVAEKTTAAGCARASSRIRFSLTPRRRPTRSIRPLIIRTRSGQTIIGGYVYRGKKIKALRGVYVFADYLGSETGDFTGRIFTLNFEGTTASHFQDITDDLFPTRVGNFSLLNPASLGENARGELYIADISSGNIFQIVRGR